MTLPAADGSPIDVTFRLPNGADQEEVSPWAAAEQRGGGLTLLQRCIKRIAGAAGTDEDGVAALSAARAPRSSSAWRSSRHRWTGRGGQLRRVRPLVLAPFDIQRFFFGELRTDDDLLYHEVHYLAYHYHWSETRDHAMTRDKRHNYIEVLADAIEEAQTVAPEGYLHRVLADGARPFRYRAGVARIARSRGRDRRWRCDFGHRRRSGSPLSRGSSRSPRTTSSGTRWSRPVPGPPESRTPSRARRERPSPALRPAHASIRGPASEEPHPVPGHATTEAPPPAPVRPVPVVPEPPPGAPDGDPLAAPGPPLHRITVPHPSRARQVRARAPTDLPTAPTGLRDRRGRPRPADGSDGPAAGDAGRRRAHRTRGTATRRRARLR